MIWAKDAITGLGTLGGPASIGQAISDLGQAAATSETASGAVGTHAGGRVARSLGL